MKIVRRPVAELITLNDVAEHVIDIINRNLKSEGAAVAGFAWDVRHGDVSNSHDCPIDGVTNWGRKANKPTSYPGWNGRVWIRYSKPIKSFGSEPFRNTLTYTGTGGWGSYNGPWAAVSTARYKNKDAYPEPQIYSWDYRFFDSDFPGLETGRAFDRIRGATIDQHSFRWDNAELAVSDSEFLASMLSSG